MRAETDVQPFPVPGIALGELAAQILPFLLALVVYMSVCAVMRPGPTGDEPHYLLAAQSLVRDGDVDLANDYASRARVLEVYGEFPLESHAWDFRGDGELRSVHGYGLPALLAPAFALGGVLAARAVMILLAALLADQLFRLLRDLGIGRPWRILAWAAVVFCVPLVLFSAQVYPEVPGALILVAILRISLRASPPWPALLGGALGAACLPWLHVRFILPAVVATAALAYRAGSGRRLLLVVAPPALSLAALALAFQRWYGSPLPNAAYAYSIGGDLGAGGPGFLYHYLLTDLFHPGDGWIPYAPVAWLGLAGVGLVVWRWRWAGAAALAAVALYAGFVAANGLPVGYQFPGRILLVALVLVAVPLALVLEHVPVARFAFVPLLAVSLAIAVAAVLDHDSAYPVNGGRDDARLPVVRDLAPAFPDPRSGDPRARCAARARVGRRARCSPARSSCRSPPHDVGCADAAAHPPRVPARHADRNRRHRGLGGLLDHRRDRHLPPPRPRGRAARSSGCSS